MSEEVTSILKKVLSNYDVPGTMIEANSCVNGHINDTYRVTLDNGDEFILQRINSYVFKEPVKVMENIKEVGLHLQSKKDLSADCEIISFLESKSGDNYTIVDGEYRYLSS